MELSSMDRNEAMQKICWVGVKELQIVVENSRPSFWSEFSKSGSHLQESLDMPKSDKGFDFYAYHSNASQTFPFRF